MEQKMPSLRNKKRNFRRRSQINKLMKLNTEMIALLLRLRFKMENKSFAKTPSSILLWNSPRWRSIRPKQI
jgi:hypothetical protein